MFYKNFQKLISLPYKILFYLFIYHFPYPSIYLYISLSIVYLSIYLYIVSIYLFAYNLSIFQSNYLSIKPFSLLFILYIILFYLPLLWTIRSCYQKIVPFEWTRYVEGWNIISKNQLKFERNRIQRDKISSGSWSTTLNLEKQSIPTRYIPSWIFCILGRKIATEFI